MYNPSRATAIANAIANAKTITVTEYLNNLSENVTRINLSNKGLTSIPSLARFTKLKTVELNGNKLTKLPEMPNGVCTIDCVDNNLETLEGLPDSVQNLFASSNNIKIIHKLPTNLRRLHISKNGLQSIAALPPLLSILLCDDNNLTKLPQFPNTLYMLWCFNNRRLKALPEIPGSLRVLFCSRCSIRRIPRLPEALHELICNDNPIMVIENLPTNLRMQSTNLGNLPILKILNNFKSKKLSKEASIVFYRTHLKTIQRARELRHALKLKDRLRAWLWERVRLPKVERANHPDLLARYRSPENDEDMEEVMENFGIVNFGI